MMSGRAVFACVAIHVTSSPVPDAYCTIRDSHVPLDSLRSNSSRMWQSITTMASLGLFEGPEGSQGVSREALTDIDVSSRRLLDSWAKQLRLHRDVDVVGNTYYRRPGRKPGSGVVAFGSHLDTQPEGGRFDGSYGVLAGLEVLRVLDESGIETDADLELVNWSNEEGCRFSPPMMGSGVATGQLSVEAARSSTARNDPATTFGSELQRHALVGTAVADVKSRSWTSYFEAHIEQGPTLYDSGVPVGVVIGGQGQRLFTVHVSGFEGHSGTVPMDKRQDALVCASAMVIEVRNIGISYTVLTTVGSFSVSPGSFNTIPGRVTFSIDMRSPNTTAMDLAEEKIRRRFASIAALENCPETAITRTKSRNPIEFDPQLSARLHDAASTLGLQASSLWSGAGHDACYVAEKVPAAMLFAPCKDGISHNPRESATPADLALGVDVLLRAVLGTAVETAC
ncbi:unnamed protein product [Prorocentrum cordatum]|uniref:Zn-dependent hydrolase n=1 Tax=Prorocentrum cordatum TaxID=2364126 RepID=A0ABN9S3U0_9DINO|nr:unnamed protein product [Polarella glacialis]